MTTTSEHDKATMPLHHEDRRKAREDDLAADLDPRSIGSNAETVPKRSYLTISFMGSFLATCFASMSLFAGFVMPFYILAIINEDLGPDPAYVWIPLVYTLCAALTYALVGRLSDIFGRRWFTFGANFVGLIGNIIAATATRIEVVIGGTALVAIAGAMQLLQPILLGELVPNKYRSYIVGAVWTTSLPFSAFGLVIARNFVLHTSAGWRWCYYLNIILTGLVCVLLLIFYHPPSLEMLHARNRKSLITYLDLGGISIFTIALTLFILGLSWGGQNSPWKSGQVIGTVVVGAVLLIAFGLYELFMPIKYPPMPPRLLKNSAYIGVVLTASAGAMIYYSLNVIWPLQIAALYSTNILEIGWISCTLPAGTIAGGIFGSFTVRNVGHQKYQLIYVTVAMTAFIGSVSAATQHSKALAIAMVTVGSFFVGMIEGITVVVTPLCLEQEDIELAIGMLGTIRTALSTIATAVYVDVLTSKLTTNIPKYVGAAAVQTGTSPTVLEEILAGFAVGTTAFLGVSPRVVVTLGAAYQTAYAQSFRTVYLTSIAFGVCAIVAACFSPNVDHRFNNEIARRMITFDISRTRDCKTMEGAEQSEDPEKAL